MTGSQRIREAFARARRQGRAALAPYLAIGHPSPAAMLDLIPAVEHAGADLMELGIPFSDPLADGPVIQMATQRALAQGMTVAGCLETVHTLRARGVTIPLVFMGYYNPLLAYGLERFCREAATVGADGLIVPDLPPEEGGALEGFCAAQGLALVYLLAPTSTPERIRLVVNRTTGFVYCVSVTGITGARAALPPGLADFLARVRAAIQQRDGANRPYLIVGFGISTPQQAAEVGRLADGVVVGSALVKRVNDAGDPAQVASEFVARLRGGMAARA
ncbi:MAG: tryptophan synthase subunit alpha, partial [Anaerolineae bacterium]|nr:tryptophan synthase subunit alpha [Anaerolineae bacterium]